MDQVVKLVAYAFGTCAFLLFLGFGIGGATAAPEYALVFVDANRMVYIAPSCVSRQEWTLYPHLSLGQARKLKLDPEPKCRDEGGFIQEDRSASGHLLEKIGALGPLPSRWNRDGTWNW